MSIKREGEVSNSNRLPAAYAHLEMSEKVRQEAARVTVRAIRAVNE